MLGTIENKVGQSAPPAHLAVSGIRKSFGGVHALRGVDFEVGRGEVMALVGDNGAGKSTLMKVLAGAHQADEGTFFMDGREVGISSPHDAFDHGIQIVYQDLALCENLDVSANLSLGAEPVKTGWRFLPRFLRPIDSMAMEEKALAAIERLQVRTLKSVRAKVGGLSGGQRQAIAIARAVGADSSVVLLDEPTAALGVAQTRQVLDVVKTLAGDQPCGGLHLAQSERHFRSCRPDHRSAPRCKRRDLARNRDNPRRNCGRNDDGTG